ncbi:MAG TPA: hypothetical protein VF024_19285 [Solirubrobacteraceae bacterium]
MTTRPTYQGEDRDDLEYRFRALSAVLLACREQIPYCERTDCLVCALAAAPVDIPPSVLAPGHQPREDLEQAAERVALRLQGIAQLDEAPACTAGRKARAFYDDCERALRGQQ